MKSYAILSFGSIISYPILFYPTLTFSSDALATATAISNAVMGAGALASAASLSCAAAVMVCWAAVNPVYSSA